MLPTDMKIRGSAAATFGANGALLVVKGHITLSVSMGQLTVMHQFTVIQDLTMPCLLGAEDTMQLLIMITVDSTYSIGSSNILAKKHMQSNS